MPNSPKSKVVATLDPTETIPRDDDDERILNT